MHECPLRRQGVRRKDSHRRKPGADDGQSDKMERMWHDTSLRVIGRLPDRGRGEKSYDPGLVSGNRTQAGRHKVSRIVHYKVGRDGRRVTAVGRFIGITFVRRSGANSNRCPSRTSSAS